MSFRNIIAIAVAFAAQSAVANELDIRPYEPTRYSAKLHTINLDETLPYAYEVTQGAVTVDYHRKQVTLVLHREFTCMPDTFCTQVMPEPVVITLPVTSVQMDRCGNVRTIAELGEDHPDAIHERIEIRDYSQSSCKPETSETLVRYTTSGGFTGHMTRSEAHGEALVVTEDKI